MVYNSTEYADETRSIVFGLHRAGVPICLDPLEARQDPNHPLAPDEIETLELLKHRQIDFARGVLLQHLPAHNFNLAMHGRTRIGRTTFETDRIPESWREFCEALDEIWVPSRFNVDSFAAGGVSPHRLRMIPSGVNTTLFRPALEPLPLPTPRRRGFHFLSVFEWTQRTAPDVLLRAYLSEFKPDEDVALILKAYARPNVAASLFSRVTWFVEREMGMRIEDTPSILLYDPSSLSAAEIPRLYASADAFVLPSRGEGCGRPYMEALSCGCPVIATRWGGQMDFLNDQNSELVDSTLAPVPWDADGELFAGHRWAEPSVDQLRERMRHVFEHPQESRLKAMRGRAEMVANRDWDRVIQNYWVPEFERLLGGV
jgi:glycosyltransferase involved in cell wall biosynthesis